MQMPTEFAAHAQSIQSLAALIEATADTAEREARLSDDVARALARAGLHRLAAPKSVGGLESHPLTQMLAIEQVARIDGATGWNLMIGIETQGILAAMLPLARARDLLSNPELIISGALNPLGRADVVDGGYCVGGQWPFASGCQNCDYFWGQAFVWSGGERVRNARGQSQLIEVVLPRSALRILPTWHVAGLRGSGSHDVSVEDVFVPAAMTTRVQDGVEREEGPLYRLPVHSRLAYNKVGVATGIARHALDAFVSLAHNKRPRGSARPLAERADAQRAIADAERGLRSARAFVFEMVEDLWTTVLAGHSVTREQRVLLQLACSHAAGAAVDAVGQVHAVAGTSANRIGEPLERCFRDVQVVRQQIMVSGQWIQAAGRALLGVDPEAFMM